MNTNEFIAAITILIIAACLFGVTAVIIEKIADPGIEEIETTYTTSYRELTANVSAYCPCSRCCGAYADGVTANGYHIQKGDKFIAAPKEFGFGTQFIIDGYNNNEPVKVLDRGGAITGNKLDLYFDTHEEALEWGRREIVVKILN